jgi:hypothetical protein
MTFLGCMLVTAFWIGEGNVREGVDFELWTANTNYSYARLAQDFGDYATLFNSWGVAFPFFHTQIVGDVDSKAIRVTYPAGLYSDTGSGAGWRTELDQPQRGLTLSLSFAFDPDFAFVRGGKMHGLCSAMCYSNGAVVGGDGMSARFMWREDHPDGARLVVYTYHPEMPGTYGQDLPLLYDPPMMVMQPDSGLYVPLSDETFYVGYEERDFVGSWPVVRVGVDQWHHLKLRVYLNEPGLRNGSMQVWLDDQVVLNMTGLYFAYADAPPENYLLNYLLFQTFHGGGDASWAPPRDVYAYYDDFLLEDATCHWLDVDCNCNIAIEELTPVDATWGCRDIATCDVAVLDRNGNGRVEVQDLILYREELGWSCD